jgi:hypothetical protein
MYHVKTQIWASGNGQIGCVQRKYGDQSRKVDLLLLAHALLAGFSQITQTDGHYVKESTTHTTGCPAVADGSQYSSFAGSCYISDVATTKIHERTFQLYPILVLRNCKLWSWAHNASLPLRWDYSLQIFICRFLFPPHFYREFLPFCCFKCNISRAFPPQINGAGSIGL